MLLNWPRLSVDIIVTLFRPPWLPASLLKNTIDFQLSRERSEGEEGEGKVAVRFYSIFYLLQEYSHVNTKRKQGTNKSYVYGVSNGVVSTHSTLMHIPRMLNIKGSYHLELCNESTSLTIFVSLYIYIFSNS